jgi:ubiquinone/menaquinone biosynthesis C-methylase UbiE
MMTGAVCWSDFMADISQSYYRDHWVDIEPERMSRYEAMFVWRDVQEPLIAPADVASGQTVVDYGCGPGGLAIELARRVGSGGKVVGLDINAEFLRKTREVCGAAGLGERIDTVLLEDERIPLADQSVDRVLCKNVLEYVPDPDKTIGEFFRILKPGGIAHVSDSDWGAVMFEPARDRFARIMSAATVAFRTPLIGRSLYGMFRRAGFGDVGVQILAGADTTGTLRSVLQNMAGYAGQSGRLDDGEIEEFLREVDAAMEAGTYFAVLPQFLVTGRV